LFVVSTQRGQRLARSTQCNTKARDISVAEDCKYAAKKGGDPTTDFGLLGGEKADDRLGHGHAQDRHASHSSATLPQFGKIVISPSAIPIDDRRTLRIYGSCNNKPGGIEHVMLQFAQFGAGRIGKIHADNLSRSDA